MNIYSISQLVPISQLQRNYSSLIQKVKKITEPLLLLRRNKPEAVLISFRSYEELVEKKRLYEEKLAEEAIKNFEKDRKEGKLLMAKKPEDFFKKQR